MLKRSITGIILVAIILTCVFWLRQYSLVFADIVIMFFAVVGAFEMFKSLKKGGFNPFALPVMLSCIIIYPLTLWLNSSGILITIALGGILSVANLVLKHKTRELKDLAATIFIIIYPLSIMMLMSVMNHALGDLLSIFLIFAIVVLTDSMAYFVGVTVKGPKMCPSISPKKTISGGIGGLFGGMIGAVITFLMFDCFSLFDSFKNVTTFGLFENIWISLPVYLFIGLIGGILSEIGDLGASIIKRKIGIKDYGNIFPGHGGVMDRIDSFLFVIPAVFIAFEIITVVG